MFDVIAQFNESEQIKLDKRLTTVATYQGGLREDSSLLDPHFLIEAPLSDFSSVNYLTVPDFGRGYFITGIDTVEGGLVEIRAHVDVLSSFKTQIRANKAIVHRQENNWNLYLNDGVLRAYQNPEVSVFPFDYEFEGQSYVLVLAGFHNRGDSLGETTTYSPDAAGAGNTEGKTTAGLRQYAAAQLGKPYWFGTFGQVSTNALLEQKRNQYPDQYPDPGNPPFADQVGQRVQDCVGLIKGYRWINWSTGQPEYNAAQDVDVAGLWSQCTRLRGPISTLSEAPLGAVLFYADMSHCGVYYDATHVIEARGHAYGVVSSLISSRNFAYWGVPNWLNVYTETGGPKITQQPQNTSGPLGGTFSMTVAATGTDLSYQWQYYNTTTQAWVRTTISGNTTPTISGEITEARIGVSYRCRITDGAGTIIYSDPATLTLST